MFQTAASHGRMSWKDFAGKLLVIPGEDTTIADKFTGRLPRGAGSLRELHRMEFRAHHQKEIRSGGATFFKNILIHRCLQRAFTHPSLEGKYSKRRRSNVVAVILVKLVIISSFLFYCLLLNQIFPISPNSITNCFKLFSLLQLTTTLLLRSLF